MSEPTLPAHAAPTTTPATRARFPRGVLVGLALGLGLPLGLVLARGGADGAARPQKAPEPKVQPEQPEKKPAAPELTGGVAWLNTGGPLSLHKDLKGKVVLLDFWTFCCINCMHVLPDLHRLEKKYPNELVVVGVHSPKFDSERDTNNIRKAILRYQIDHPVVNDADRKIWDRYEVEAWPTLVLIDPEGSIVGFTSGEGNYEILDKVIGRLVDEHRKKKTLNDKPIRFDLARYRESGDAPLFFPGKVLADGQGKRLFIADSTHHRVVVTDLGGKFVAAIGKGTPGLSDGSFGEAEFHDPQGMAVRDDTLYVADRKNHVIREVNLKNRTVRTIAGTGEQDHGIANRLLDRPVPARSIGLNSPWDLLLEGDTLYVAMAGDHQIWAYDLKKRDIGPYAGSGRENIGDAPLQFANFAQPSGLATDGKNLYVADSEISALRKVPLGGAGRVQTLVGRGLFVFGDQDGPGQDGGDTSRTEARLQHALGVAYHDDKLYVADTYNNKIKVFDLKTRELKTLLGRGDWGWLVPQLFHEPGGISYLDGKLYVADTNAHRVVVVDVAKKTAAPLKLTGVEPPATPKEPEPKK
jgi:thiol-disulfide isomerase/thioredoxin